MEDPKQLNKAQQYLLEQEKKKIETPEQKFERLVKEVFKKGGKKSTHSKVLTRHCTIVRYLNDHEVAFSNDVMSITQTKVDTAGSDLITLKRYGLVKIKGNAVNNYIYELTDLSKQLIAEAFPPSS